MEVNWKNLFINFLLWIFFAFIIGIFIPYPYFFIPAVIVGTFIGITFPIIKDTNGLG